MTARLLSFTLLFVFGMYAYSSDVPLEFEQADKQLRYQELLKEIRCLVCQNQSLADSSAGLAQDLRVEIYEMIAADRSNEEIIDFLVKRYGDFVLFRPPVRSSTWLLWFAPFIFLVISVIVVVRFVRSHTAAVPPELSAEEQSALSGMMDDIDKEKSEC